MSAAKKSKTSQEIDLEAVRQYLLDCPSDLVPKDSQALQVALKALDQERKRMERDAKLQRKFSANNTTTSTETTKPKNTASTSTAKAQPKTAATNEDDDDAELLEWQDVASHSIVMDETPDATAAAAAMEGSILGTELAQASIVAMANANTTVTCPLAAIALALHAALCSDTLGFKCTGIPQDDTKKSGGFAPPIREIAQLVPDDWDVHSEDPTNPRVAFRYRKNGVGSTVLKVNQDGSTVRVELVPTTIAKEEPHGNALTFPVEHHVNLESLGKALRTQKRVVPTLHYKALPVLLTNMCNAFDVGPVKDSIMVDENHVSQQEPQQQPYVDTTIVSPFTTDSSIYTTRVPPPQYETPNINVFQPERRRGDFASDLIPGGVDPLGGGNLMGPNHPMFTGGGGPTPPPLGGGGYGMHPRFDPYGPPGGPTDPNRPLDDPNNPQRGNRGRPPPPGGPGDPNPDHERPPHNLGNNMFM